MTTESGRRADRSKRRGSGFWPLVLIVIGIFLILGNLGWLDWNVLWSLTYLWPLLLVAVGVDMLLRGRYRLLVIVVTLAVGAAIYTAYPNGLFATGASGETVDVRQPLEGARQADVTVSAGVASLDLSSAGSADLLAQGTIRPAMGEQIEQSFEVSGGTARLVIDSRGPGFRGPVGAGGGLWDLTLSGRVPMELKVDTGVGRARLELSGLTLTSLDLDTGVGAATITLPATGVYDVDIDTGVGAATIQLPAGLGARITVSRGIGGISMPSDFLRDEAVYESPDYGSARDRVDITLETGIGAVSVERIR